MHANGTHDAPRRGVLTHPAVLTKAVRIHEAAEVGIRLHDLSLLYWSEGRIDDAWRVGLEAMRVLRSNLPGSVALARVRSTLRAMSDELAGGPASDRIEA